MEHKRKARSKVLFASNLSLEIFYFLDDNLDKHNFLDDFLDFLLEYIYYVDDF